MVSAAEVKKAREMLQESQSAFGARFDVDQSTVHRWETDGPPKKGPAQKALKGLLDEMAAKAEAEPAQ